MRVTTLDTGHLADRELGLDSQLARAITERPKAHLAREATRVARTRAGNLVKPRPR